VYKWRQQLDSWGKADKMKKAMSKGMKVLFERPWMFNAAMSAGPLLNVTPRFIKYVSLNDWGKGRDLPDFAKESFNAMWKNHKVQEDKK
jgi:L-lactate dehydrogenase complex protein LldF